MLRPIAAFAILASACQPDEAPPHVDTAPEAGPVEVAFAVEVDGFPFSCGSQYGDIGATAEQYAREAFERYKADAVTVNPYMGFDSIEPYLQWNEKGLIVLCRTSNPGGSDLQALQVVGKTPLQHMTRRLPAY